MQIHPNYERDKIKEKIFSYVENYFHDIPCTMNNDIRHEMMETSIASVIEWIGQSNPIITGNGAFFKQHKEYLAPTVVMLESLQKYRKSLKKEMFQYPKGSIKYIILNTAQGCVKVIMNADYGGSGSQFAPFYSVYIPPATTGTAKNVTTTLICCLEFLSANNNKWCKIRNINGLFDMINIVLNDTSERELINDTFSVDEVLKYLVSRIDYYTPKDVDTIKRYLETLSNDQLSKLRLSFDVKFVIERYLSAEMRIISNYLKDNQMNFDEEITKESLHKSGFGTEAPEAIKDNIEHIKKVILDNCCYNFMLNDAEIRANEMERCIVCVTDTDSLMVHFPAYIDTFQARVQDFRDSCLIAGAFGIRLFIEGIIPRMVEYIASNINIEDEYYRKKFVFKNEFGFLAMALCAKKMYATSEFVQEGAPRNIKEIGVSGMSFKKRDAPEFLEPIMVNLYRQNILTTKKIQVQRILDEYYQLRDKLSAELEQVTNYYQVAGLKDVEAYDQSKTLPEGMRGSIIWNNMFPEELMQPLDRVIVIRLSFKQMYEHLTEHPRIEQLYSLCVKSDPDMKHTPVICLPQTYKTVPEWLRPCIDKDAVIDKLTSPFKQMLDLFDVYMPETKNGIIASRMMYL
jgi:hypothetical protein